MKGKFIWLATMAVILASCEKENNKVGNQPDKKKKVEIYLNAYNDIWN